MFYGYILHPAAINTAEGPVSIAAGADKFSSFICTILPALSKNSFNVSFSFWIIFCLEAE